MSRDDYFVIVYQVLKYLYDCLKKGERPDKDLLNEDEYSIPKQYWEYILISLLNVYPVFHLFSNNHTNT